MAGTGLQAQAGRRLSRDRRLTVSLGALGLSGPGAPFAYRNYLLKYYVYFIINENPTPDSWETYGD